MVNRKKEELLRALWVIYSTCSGYKDCCKCPLRNRDDSGCYIEEKPPVKWEMNKAEEEWRAFYE